MAITVNTTPQSLVPVYNPFYYGISSSNTAQPNFKYVIDIYTGSTAQPYAARLKMLPRPGGAANCIVSPARVLESFLSYDRSAYNTLGFSISTNCILNYTLSYGEEYGTSSTGTTIYSALTTSTGYTWNGVLPYNAISLFVYNHDHYYLRNHNSTFMTTQPSNVFIRSDTDMQSLSFMNNYAVSSGSVSWFQVNITDMSGSSRAYNIRNDSLSGASPNYIVNHFGVGIYNLNNTPSSSISGGTTISIDLCNDAFYTVTPYSSSFALVGPVMTYTLDKRTSKYPAKRLMWLNPLGGWDFFNILLVSRKTVNVTRGTYKQVLSPYYVIGDRGETVIDIDAQESYLVTSDYVLDSESVWLETLFTSSEVYEMKTDGTIWPIIIDSNSIEIKRTVNDKFITYDFNYSHAFKLDSQRN